MTGIYKIHNITNDHIYIGSANNCATRKNGHLSDLRKNKHPNSYLQRAFNKYGEKSFIFSVIEETTKEALLEREQYWIDLAQAEESSLYNLELTATRSHLISDRRYWLGKKRSEEDKEKFRVAHTGRCGMLRKTNKTGYPGVAFNPLNSNYRARITINHVCYELGSFNQLEEAVAARQKAEKEFPGVKQW